MELVATDIRKVWEEVKPHLDELYAAGCDRPEEVYYECRAGISTLYYHPDEGFAVVGVVEDRNTGLRNLHLWVGVSYTQHGLEQHLPWLENLAREYGLDAVEFSTHRDGYNKVLDKAQWKKTTYWRRSLNG